MKKALFTILAAGSLLGDNAANISAGSSPGYFTTNIPSGGTLEITKAPVSVLLEIYASLSGLQMVTSSNVTQLGSKMVDLPAPHEGANALKSIEKGLLDQYGIVITLLDDKRASVTYNDALKINPIKDSSPLPVKTINRHLTEAQVLAIAKPLLPLPAGAKYQIAFENDRTWVVFTAPEGAQVRGGTVVLVEDIDGKAQLVNRF